MGTNCVFYKIIKLNAAILKQFCKNGDHLQPQVRCGEPGSSSVVGLRIMPGDNRSQ